MNIINEINEDLECLRYVLKNGTLNGSIVRLARMIRMTYVMMIVAILLILIFVGK